MALDSDIDDDGFWTPPDGPEGEGDVWPTPGGPFPDDDVAPGPDDGTPMPERPNTPDPGVVKEPPPVDRPAPPPGGGGGNQPSNVAGPRDYKSSYTPPAFTPSPFIMPNGMVPPGMPFSPDPHAVQLQNQALETALNTHAVQPFVNPYQASQDALIQQFMNEPVAKPFVNPFQSAQDTLMQKFLNEPQYDQAYINGLNEQQKEIALAREGQANRGLLQRAASRGVQAGGQVQAGMRRASQDTTSNLLQSQRDINLDVEGRNREGYERAVGLSDALNRARSEEQFRIDTTNREAYERGLSLSNQLASGQADRDYRTDTANRSALLDALGMSETIYGGREDRGLNTSRFMETIREYDQDLLNRQAEFSAGSNFGYDQLNSGNKFNYDSLNSMNEREWLNYLARLAGR